MPTSLLAALSFFVALRSSFAAPTRTTDVTAYPAKVTPNFLDGEGAYLRLERRQDANITMPVLNKQGCLPPGTTAKQMNLVLAQGGNGAKVILCPGTNYPIANTLIFASDYQEIMTLGYPTGPSRATLTVVGDGMAVAIYGACDLCTGIAMRSIQINGNRPALGPVSGGAAIIEIGGNPAGQIVRDCNIFEPRGWSALHIIEGWNNNCRNASILNNQIGPSGNSPNTAQQFKRAVAYQGPGYWADGISNACAGSTIKGNTIVDATDGAIVQFGAPNTTISGNTIISRTRVALGGINMVDMGAWGGDYTNVLVEGNVFRTEGAMIKIGIPLGPFTWSPVNNTDYRTRNGRVSNNKFLSTGSGYFGYAIAAAGHNNTDIRGNDVSGAKFGGIPSGWCVGDVPPPRPVAPGIVYDPYTTYGSVQTTGVQKTLAFLICIMQSSYGTYTWASSAAPSSSAAVPSSTVKAGPPTPAPPKDAKVGKGPPAPPAPVKVGKLAAVRAGAASESTATDLPLPSATATADDAEDTAAAAVVKSGKVRVVPAVAQRDVGVNSALLVARGAADERAYLRDLEARAFATFDEGPASPWAKRDVLEAFEASDMLL